MTHMAEGGISCFLKFQGSKQAFILKKLGKDRVVRGATAKRRSGPAFTRIQGRTQVPI